MAKKAFAFHFKNPIQGTEEALTGVLFINDAPTEVDVLRLDAEAEPAVTITLKVVDDKVVSDSNYHFKLTFRPEELALPEGILLDASHAAQWGLVCILEGVPAASAEGEHAPGDVDLYFLYKGDTELEVSTDHPLSLTLRNVGAASKGGTRTTLAQLSLNKRGTVVDKFVMLAGEPDAAYNLIENAGLDLLAPRVLAVPTLMAGFVSSDIILNDGAAENGLLLRIVNMGLLPISLSPEGSPRPSRFTLRFDAADGDDPPLWALGTASQVDQILIPAKKTDQGVWVIDPGWSGKDDWTVAHTAGETTWTLTPKARQTSLSPGEALEVPMGKIVTGHATGRTALRIGYSGLPSYGDGELVAFIQKYPLVFTDKLVGVGTVSPSEKLTVQTVQGYGITHSVGDVKLCTWVGNTGENAKGGLGTQSNHPLYFFTNRGTRMTLTTDGNVGIGTASPSEKLHVAGHLRVNGEFKKGNGPFVLWANTDKVANADLLRLMDGNENLVLTLNSDGRLKDKTGFLVPVGTIVAYGGSAAPAGWLLCTGGDHSSTTYAELAQVLGTTYGNPGAGKFRVPSLAARVPIGAYTGYVLGAIGGEFAHTLTTDEMPAHIHSVTDLGHSHSITPWDEGGSNETQIIGESGHVIAVNRSTNPSSTGISIKSTGGGKHHNNMQPYTVVNYIIKY